MLTIKFYSYPSKRNVGVRTYFSFHPVTKCIWFQYYFGIGFERFCWKRAASRQDLSKNRKNTRHFKIQNQETPSDVVPNNRQKCKQGEGERERDFLGFVPKSTRVTLQKIKRLDVLLFALRTSLRLSSKNWGFVFPNLFFYKLIKVNKKSGISFILFRWQS